MSDRLSARRIFPAVLLAQSAIALGLLTYLALSDKALVMRFAVPETAAEAEDPDELLIPVAGVLPADLRDSYGAPRSGGRSHQGLDILAPEGTPVLAAAAGVVVGLDTSALGGISLYQRDLDQRTIYFYGHLQRYRPGLKEGDLVRRGEALGYVGETGNVPPGTPHLHFSIHTVTDPNNWWRGQNLSPCDLLPCPAPEADAPR